MPLIPVEPDLLVFGSSAFATKGALDAQFPFGTYTLEAINSSTTDSQTESIIYSQDAFPVSIPAFSSSTFLGLQGMDPSLLFTITFNSFLSGAVANESFVFVSITDPATELVAFSASFLPPGTTSVGLAANTLQYDTEYQINLIFSNRIADVSPGYREDLGFDFSTFATFRTWTVPEPGSASLFGIGFLSMVVCLAIRRRNGRL